MKYKYVFFDFDGTVADTKRGIIDGASYALRQFGIDADSDTLYKFVGPTLWHSFETLFGFDYDQQQKAVDIYREYYYEKGMYEADIYPGLMEILKELKDSGCILGIASAKNEKCVVKSCEYYGVNDLFDAVVGSFEDGGRSGKYELIEELMRQLSVEDVSQCLFIGDSHTDFEGADLIGMDFVAALYDRDDSEFEGKNCTYYAHFVDDIKKIVMEM